MVTLEIVTGLPVAVPPFGKVHLSVSPEVAVAVNVKGCPVHTGLGEAVTFVGAEIGLIDTCTVVAGDVQFPLSDCVTK